MARNAYIGVSQSVADTEWVTITADNLSTYFTVTNDTYYFVPSGSTFTSNNNGKNSTTAKTSLKPLKRIYAWKFNYLVSSESGYDTFTCSYGSTTSLTTVIDAVSGTVNSSFSSTTQISTSRYINFIYEKDSSSASGNDKVVISNFQIQIRTGTYTDKQLARKVVNMYIGVNNIARRVKKAYIGINGVARIFYSIPPVERGATIELTTYHTGSDTYFTAAGNSKYGIFSDCYEGSSYIYLVDTNGTVTVKTQTNYTGMGQAGCHFSSYGLFMGIDGHSKYGFKINTSGTISTTYFGSGSAKEYMYSNGTGCNAGPLGSTFALFPGGIVSSGRTNILDYMNSSGTWKYTTLSVSAMEIAVADNGTLAIMAGGSTAASTLTSTVNTFNTSGTRSTTTSLSTAVDCAAGARAGSLAIITGGSNSSNEKMISAYSYNTSGTRTVLSNMRAGRTWHSGASGDGRYAVFMGTINYDTTDAWYGDFYDSSGTKVDVGKLGYCVDIGALAYVDNKIYCADHNNTYNDEFVLSTHVFNDI